MGERHDQLDSRREWLRKAGRWAAGGALAVLGVLAGGRGGEATAKGQACIGRGVCRGCGAREECELPAALSAKQARGRERP